MNFHFNADHNFMGGGGGGIGVYKFEAKSAIRQWSCLNLDPLKALL